MAVILALTSAIFYGVSDFSGGLATRRITVVGVVLVSNVVSLLLSLLAVTALPGSIYNTADLLWGSAGGAVGLVGVVLLYRGLAMGPMSVVAPLTAVLSAVLPAAVGIIRGDRPPTTAVAGIAIALVAVVLIGREAGDGGSAGVSRGALLSALAAGVGFGAFFILLAQTGGSSGAWPLVGQRGTSLLLLLLVLAAGSVVKGPVVPTGRVLALAAFAGATEFAANLTYLLASHRGLLALVAVISSLYPAATVLLARVVLSERMSRPQRAGLLLAIGAVVLIAVR